MSLIDLFPKISIALRIFLTLSMTVGEAKRAISLHKGVNIYQRSKMMQERLDELATPSINC